MCVCLLLLCPCHCQDVCVCQQYFALCHRVWHYHHNGGRGLASNMNYVFVIRLTGPHPSADWWTAAIPCVLGPSPGTHLQPLNLKFKFPLASTHLPKVFDKSSSSSSSSQYVSSGAQAVALFICHNSPRVQIIQNLVGQTIQFALQSTIHKKRKYFIYANISLNEDYVIFVLSMNCCCCWTLGPTVNEPFSSSGIGSVSFLNFNYMS